MDMPPSAQALLTHMCQVEVWVRAADERAEAYVDADAVRMDPGGRVSFHRERFLETMLQADPAMALAIAHLAKEDFHNPESTKRV